MDLTECKDIVRAFFKEHKISDKLKENKQLFYNNKSYFIRPDEAFLYKDHVIIIEYESTKRPVESISKYWWLFKVKKWNKQRIKIKYCIFIIKDHGEKIRSKTVIILGKALARKYPNLFEFNYLLPKKICKENIIEKLKNLL